MRLCVCVRTGILRVAEATRASKRMRKSHTIFVNTCMGFGFGLGWGWAWCLGVSVLAKENTYNSLFLHTARRHDEPFWQTRSNGRHSLCTLSQRQPHPLQQMTKMGIGKIVEKQPNRETDEIFFTAPTVNTEAEHTGGMEKLS